MIIKSDEIVFNKNKLEYPKVFNDNHKKLNWCATIFDGWLIREDLKVLRRGKEYHYPEYCSSTDSYYHTFIVNGVPTFTKITHGIIKLL